MHGATIDLENDSLFGLAIGTLWFCGAMYILAGIFMAVAMVGPIAMGPHIGAGEAAIMATVGGCSTLLMVAIIAANFAAAWGLKQRKKWAWLTALILGALYAPSGCLPFGVLILYALLRTGVKEAFEADAARAQEGPIAF